MSTGPVSPTRRRLLWATVAAAWCTLLLATPAAAQGAGWSITSFAADITVHPDGTLEVVEDIAVDFDGLTKHGIYRIIPVRAKVPPQPWYDLPDGTSPDRFLRAIDISDIRVSSDTAPGDLEVSRPGPVASLDDTVSMRIGNADRTVSGPQRYRIAYRVTGAMDVERSTSRPELVWNVTGNAWEVPIGRATAVVHGAEVTRVACFRGTYGTTDTCQAARSGQGATLTTQGLDPGEGMTVALEFADGSVTVPQPSLVSRWTFSSALMGSGWAVPVSVVVTLLGILGVAVLAFRQGRDRVARGDVSVDGRVRGAPTTERRRGLFEPRTVPVRYRPPDDLRPGQLGLIVDESVDPVDVSATIVDLAVRGHLTIEETESKVLWFSRTDWTLRRAAQPPDEELLTYEQTLLDGLFDDGDEVAVSDLKGTFASDYKQAVGEIYADGQRRRWFARRPDKARGLWLALGVVAMVASLGLFVLAMLFTTFALVAAALFVASLVLVAVHRRMPRRTVRGSRLLTDTLGFREFVVTAEADRMDFAERENIFVGYLPYAVVFGAVDKWARTFAELGVDTAAAVGGFYVGAHGFNAVAFSSGLSDFSSSIGSSLAATPSGGSSGSGFSGGGFSGGGFGGGGGGSW